MSDVEIRIDGLADLQRQLDELPARLERNVLRGALRAGARVIQDEAKRHVPVKSGALRDSIRVSMRVRGGLVQAFIRAGGRGKGEPFYAHLVEFGTSAHEERPKGAKSLFFAGVFSSVINHPGAQEKPFMRPAFDGGAPRALDAVVDYLTTRIPRELGKQGS